MPPRTPALSKVKPSGLLPIPHVGRGKLSSPESGFADEPHVGEVRAPALDFRSGSSERAGLPQRSQKTIRPISTATTMISQRARNVAPISPSSVRNLTTVGWDTESTRFATRRTIARHFCGERGEPSGNRNAYLSIRITAIPRRGTSPGSYEARRGTSTTQAYWAARWATDGRRPHSA
jgi:hypothetical protein